MDDEVEDDLTTKAADEDADDETAPADGAPDDPQQDGEDVEATRATELATSEVMRKTLLGVFDRVLEGFTNQQERVDDTMDYWDGYNAKLGPKQGYNGNSQLFIPIVPNAVNARKTRFTNQVFPQSGRLVEVTTSDDKPYAVMALLEHYIRRTKLRTLVMPALCKNGDIEGQYSVYVSWSERQRHVVWRKPVPKMMPQGPGETEEVSDPDEDEDDIVEEAVKFGRPHVEVLADCDVLIEPATADSVDDALANGGSVTVLRRWSEYKVKKMLKAGDLDPAGARALLKAFSAANPESAGQEDKSKRMVDAAGIKLRENGSKHALVYETWTEITVDKERRLCRVYFGGDDIIVGCRRNPYWCDRCPVLSVPVEKVQGSAKGISKLKPCMDMQYGANDTINEAMDSAQYALMPIVMTDPVKNPRVGSMILNMAAIWETNPNDTKFAQFPELWKQGFEIVNGYRTEIFQTLSVSPAMMPQSSGGSSKRNQAEMAQEAQVDVLSTADAVTVLEEGILTPTLEWMVELDHQFRDKALTVRQYGSFGVRANMEKIPPIQMDKRYEFLWNGVEQARNQAQLQQQIAAMNVIRGIPPQQLPGYTINLVPIVSQLIENTFGSRLAPLIFEDMRAKLAMDAELENQLLSQGLELHVNTLDDDAKHVQAHQQLMQSGDPTGAIRTHILRHVMQMQMKQQGAMMAQQQQGPQGQPGQGSPGVPGGAGPGVAGTPRPGAQPMQPRGGQQPPGAVHHDRMQLVAPRR